MGEVSKEGRTILFVSHNMAAISSLCNKGIYLDQGKISYIGNTDEAIRMYMNPNSGYRLLKSFFSGPLKNDIIFKSIKINGQEGTGIVISPQNEIVLEVCGESKKEFENFRMALSVYKGDIRVFTTRDTLKATKLNKGFFEFTIKVSSYLLRPGLYSIAIGGRKDMHSEWVNGVNVCDFIIDEKWDMDYEQENEGVINIPFNGKREECRSC